MFEDIMDFEKRVQKEHDLKYREYERLRADSPKIIKVNDRVLVAIGFLGHGFHWVRGEAFVKEVAGDNSRIEWECENYKRSPTLYSQKTWSYWIPNCLIVSVLTHSKP